MKKYEEFVEYFNSIGIYHNFFIFCLNYEWGRNYPSKISRTMQEFLNSTYAENKMKDFINNKVHALHLEESFAQELSKQGESTDNYSLNSIYRCSDEFLTALDIKNVLLQLALYLNNYCAKEFLDQNTTNPDLIKIILTSSGLTYRQNHARSEVNLSDLNEKHLYSVYQKINHFNHQKALAYAKAVLNLKTINAADFVNTLYELSSTDFQDSDQLTNFSFIDYNDDAEHDISLELKNDFFQKLWLEHKADIFTIVTNNEEAKQKELVKQKEFI